MFGSYRNGSLVIFLLVMAVLGLSLITHEGAQPVAAATAGPPGTPRGLHLETGDGNVNFSWLPPHDDGGSPVTGYEVHRGTDVGAFELYNRMEDVTTFVDRHVKVGSTHYYAVLALNAAGAGPLSEIESIVPMSPPGPPSGLSVVLGNTTITLGWSVPDDLGGVNEEPWYRVHRGDAPEGPFEQVYGTKQRAFKNVGLVNGQTYHYYVVTSTHVGKSPPSEVVEGVPGIPPDPPRGLEVVTEIGKIVLSWMPPDNDGGFPLIGYHIYRYGEFTGERDFGWVNASVEQYVDTDFLYGELYRYMVASVNRKGDGRAMAEVSVLFLGPPSPPQFLVAYRTFVGIALEWQPPMIDGGSTVMGYGVFRGTDEADLALYSDSTNTTGPTIGYINSNITYGVTYFYAVVARSYYGESPLSKVVNFTYYGPPSAPLNVTASHSGDSVVVEWDLPENSGGRPIEEFLVIRGKETLEMEVIARTGMVTMYEDQDVRPDSEYYYSVVAVNSEGEGVESKIVRVEVVPPFFETDEGLLTFMAILVVALLSLWVTVRKRRGGSSSKGNG